MSSVLNIDIPAALLARLADPTSTYTSDTGGRRPKRRTVAKMREFDFWLVAEEYLDRSASCFLLCGTKATATRAASGTEGCLCAILVDGDPSLSGPRDETGVAWLETFLETKSGATEPRFEVLGTPHFSALATVLREADALVGRKF
jgi:hypothetical protein